MNISKNAKSGPVNKLISPKLKAYDDEMPTNNMIKFKSPEYSCFCD